LLLYYRWENKVGEGRDGGSAGALHSAGWLSSRCGPRGGEKRN
jgi:hypothetical protein